MNKEKKEKEIYTEINQFLKDVFLLREHPHRKQYFNFMRKVSEYAPFNNSLVFIQNPNCGYYATASVWENKFRRDVKSGSRPMVILVPFGPVSFVYDFKDTLGEDMDENKFLEWWKEESKPVEEIVIKNTLRNLDDLGVKFNFGDNWKYFRDVNLRTGGYASSWGRGDERDHEIVLNPKYKEIDMEGYGVLCHEIAHILLGHTGEIKMTKKDRDGEIKSILIAKDRSRLSKEAEEFEAEIVAWLVFNYMGIEKNSEPYLASWANSDTISYEINFVEILKIAGKIQEMSKKLGVFR